MFHKACYLEHSELNFVYTQKAKVCERGRRQKRETHRVIARNSDGDNCDDRPVKVNNN